MTKPQILMMQLSELIKNAEIVSKYRTKPSYFTRSTAKMTFDKLVMFQLSLPKKSAQAAINDHIREMRYDFTLDKQSLFEAREKLSHKIFADMNNDLVIKSAYENTYRTHRGMRMIAVDGSVFDVPYGANYFAKETEHGEVLWQSRVVAFTDVLNDYIVRADMQPYGVGETTLAKIMLKDFLKNKSNTDDLFLWDRGFFSRSLARSLEGNGKFVFRVKHGALKEIDEANEPDQIIIRKDSGWTDLRLRVINIVLPGGEIEKLVTNIFDESFSVADFAEIYSLRWGVEISFLTLKQRLQIENFSSAKQELILQDFFASVFMYNFMIVTAEEVSEVIKVDNMFKKHNYKFNKNLGIGTVRNLLIDSLLEDDDLKRKKLFEKALSELSKRVVSIRPGRSFPHSAKNKSAKFHINQKSAIS